MKKERRDPKTRADRETSSAAVLQTHRVNNTDPLLLLVAV
jgi:hypothetical protein